MSQSGNSKMVEIVTQKTANLVLNESQLRDMMRHVFNILIFILKYSRAIVKAKKW